MPLGLIPLGVSTLRNVQKSISTDGSHILLDSSRFSDPLCLLDPSFPLSSSAINEPVPIGENHIHQRIQASLLRFTVSGDIGTLLKHPQDGVFDCTREKVDIEH